MSMRFSVLLMCLLVSRAASADTIVTWQSVGEIFLSQPVGANRTPPVGTPYTLTMTMGQASIRPTLGSPAGSNCFSISASGSLAIGGYNYGLSGGTGFTHAQLPNLPCVPGYQETQFVFSVDEVPESP